MPNDDAGALAETAVTKARAMEPLIVIGLWWSEREPYWPRPQSFVDPNWDEQERQTVLAYLESGTINRAYMGFSPCRFCGANNGALEFTDGVYAWPEGLAHYIQEHALRLPAEVVAHAIARIEGLEARARDDTWWRSLGDVDGE